MTVLLFRNKNLVPLAVKHLNDISYPYLLSRDVQVPHAPRWLVVGRVNKESPLSNSYEFYIKYTSYKPGDLEIQRPELLTAVMLMPKEAIDFYLHSITE